MNLLYAGDQPNALRTSEGRVDLAGQLQEFVDAIHGQRQATVILKDATRAIAVTEQIIESANSNHVIEQKEDS
jgi:predicted dehydrogenase